MTLWYVCMPIGYRDEDDDKIQDNESSQEIKESQEEIKDSQEEVKRSQDEIKDSQEIKDDKEEVKEGQEEINERGMEINDNQDITEEEKTETIKTGRKTNTRRTTKKDGSDQQTTGKVLATCSVATTGNNRGNIGKFDEIHLEIFTIH